MVRLRHERIYGLYWAISNLFPLSDEVDDDLVVARLGEILQREESLRIVGGTLDDDGSIDYASQLDLPLRRISCDSAQEMRQHADKAAARIFERDGGPLWECVLFDYPDDDGRPARSVCAIFDHFVTDGRSMHLLEKELNRPPTAPYRVGRGKYRDYVLAQREQFPMPGHGSRGPVPEYWARHLDGTSADRPTELPFLTVAPADGAHEVTELNFSVPVSSQDLRSRAAAAGTTPFIPIFSSIASTVASTAALDDITLRVIVNGRPAGYGGAHGWFADSIPVRLRDEGLADPRRALEVVHAQWARHLDYQTSPLDYIRNACPPAAGLEVPPERRRMQLVVNFLPHDIGGMYSEHVPERTESGDIDGLHVIVLPGPEGRFRLSALFNPANFPKEPTRALLRGVVEAITAFARDRG